MILHIDMDAFYASVEQLDNPELKNKCVIVGGLSRRSVVSAASYEARKFGIHSAMPMYQAKQKCPQGIFLQPRMDRYKYISKEIMRILETFSPLVEPVSIDEAYMDISGCTKLHGDPMEIAFSIKKKIKAAVDLNCSIGIAPNKILAKIASDMDKPDGLFIITPDEAQQFTESLPIYKVPGVGKMTCKKLELIGIKTLADVKKFPEKLIVEKLGKFGKRLLELSNCIDISPVSPFSLRKSVSTETTLPEDTDNKQLLKKYVLLHAEEIGRELRKLNVKAKTITLKIKHADFKQKTKSKTIKVPTQSSEIIYKEACSLLDSYIIKKNVRLIGVGASGFVSVSVPIQMEFFQNKKNKKPNWEKVDEAMDSIIKKYGKKVIKRGTLHND